MNKIKFFNICGFNSKLENSIWIASIPNSKAAIYLRGIANGIEYFTTKRNYYCDTKAGNKLRYQTMNCDNASYNLLVDIYCNIGGGVYLWAAIASEDNISDTLEQVSKAAIEYRKIPGISDKLKRDSIHLN